MNAIKARKLKKAYKHPRSDLDRVLEWIGIEAYTGKESIILNESNNRFKYFSSDILIDLKSLGYRITKYNSWCNGETIEITW